MSFLVELECQQKAKTGRVRVIILKARQLGISTYVSARFFHRCLFEPGLRTFILGHERRASTNLFEMVKRFYEHLPEDVRPATGTFNAETLLFNKRPGYVVSVATLGRRRTIGYGAVNVVTMDLAALDRIWYNIRAAACLVRLLRDKLRKRLFKQKGRKRRCLQVRSNSTTAKKVLDLISRDDGSGEIFVHISNCAEEIL